jgi:hypothetical protein
MKPLMKMFMDCIKIYSSYSIASTKKVHIFKAWKHIVAAPKNRPKWMPEKISKPFVHKEKIEKLA